MSYCLHFSFVTLSICQSACLLENGKTVGKNDGETDAKTVDKSDVKSHGKTNDIIIANVIVTPDKMMKSVLICALPVRFF